MMIKTIDIDSEEYQQAVALRIQLFFKESAQPLQLINDCYESTATHVAYIEGGQVIGTGRLHWYNEKAVISQMAIHSQHQSKGIGTMILNGLLSIVRLSNTAEVILSARLTALPFYQKHGFKIISKEYPSEKTGIIHQKMKLTIIS